MNNENIAQNIQKLRGKRDMTQAELAENMNISMDCIIDAELGSTTITLEFLLQMCDSLEVTPNDILAGEYPSGGPGKNLVSLTAAQERDQPDREASVDSSTLLGHLIYFALKGMRQKP